MWELRLIVYSVLALNLAVELAGLARLAPAIGLPEWVAFVCVVPLKAIECRFLIYMHRLWTVGAAGTIMVFPLGIVFALAVAVGAISSHATLHSILGTADHRSAKKAEERTNLKASLALVEAQLTAASTPNVPKPAETLQATLDWYGLPRAVRQATDNCTRVEELHSRACRDMLRLRKELQVSKDYEKLKQEAEKHRAQLARIEIEDDRDPMPRSFELLFGWVGNIDGKVGIAMMLMLILQLVSMFGLYCDYLLKNDSAQGTRRSKSGGSNAEGALPARPIDSANVRSSAGALAGASSVHASFRARPTDLQANTCASNSQTSPEGAQTSPRVGCPAPARAGKSGAQSRPRVRRADAHSDLLGQSPSAPRRPANLSPQRTGSREAIAAFSSMLDWGEGLRATGSSLRQAYLEVHQTHGWPALSSAEFGRFIKFEVQENGGRKIKSNAQTYVGVGIPAPLIAMLKPQTLAEQPDRPSARP
jgi:hypothetical protein